MYLLWPSACFGLPLSLPGEGAGAARRLPFRSSRSTGGWATDPEAKVLQDAMDMENVTVLTSSKRNELSVELPEWRHGALAQAFLGALAAAADSEGIITRSALTDTMENEVESLTKGRQHLGMHVNLSGFHGQPLRERARGHRGVMQRKPAKLGPGAECRTGCSGSI